MPTTVYVLIPPSPLFAAHWSFFIPEILPFDEISKRQEESDVGRRIHVSGDRLNGFSLEIIRDYDLRKHRSVGSRRYTIGTIAQPTESSQRSSDGIGCPEKDADEGGGFIDNVPIDDLERVCVEVEAPGPSLNSAADSVGARRIKTEVKDCQWWVQQVVRVLVTKGILRPPDGVDPNAIVAILPKH